MAATFDLEKCNGCGICVRHCPEDILHMGENKKPFVKYPYECWYCGACYIDCPQQAVGLDMPLFMKFVPSPYEFKQPRTIRRGA